MESHPFFTHQYNPYLFSAICLGWTVILAMFGAWKVFWEPYTGPDDSEGSSH